MSECLAYEDDSCLRHLCDVCFREVRALRAENERLREALVVIAGRCQCGTHAGGCIHDTARAALATPEETK